MPPPPILVGAKDFSPLPEQIVPALRDIALWVRAMGERFGSEALTDSIPFSLECLADDLARVPSIEKR